MALKKQPTTGEGIIAKGKSVATTWDIISLSDLNLSPIVEETVFASSHGAAGDIDLPT